MDELGLLESFKELHVNSQKFYEKIAKEPSERREDSDRVNKLLLDTGILEQKFSTLKTALNKVESEFSDENIRGYPKEIEKYIFNSRRILLERLRIIAGKKTSLQQSQITDSNLTMTEKFDFRTAASLVPCLDGSEDTVNQLIDSIQLYSDMLTNDGKKSLVNYVLKTRLTQNAKLRLASTYNTVETLITDIKTHLLTKKSSAALASDLHSAKQNNKTIDEFAKNIEELFINLTLAQADGDETKIPILKEVNEKLAINAFSNGLKISELRTIVKARDYATLKDAIVGAKDEETLKFSNSQHSMLYMRQNNNSARGNYRGYRGRFQTNRNPSRNFSNNNSQRNNSRGRPRYFNVNNNTRNSNPNNANSVNYRGRGSSQRRHNNYRGHQTQNGQHGNYYITDLNTENAFSGNSSNSNIGLGSNCGQRFFRP